MPPTFTFKLFCFLVGYCRNKLSFFYCIVLLNKKDVSTIKYFFWNLGSVTLIPIRASMDGLRLKLLMFPLRKIWRHSQTASRNWWLPLTMNRHNSWVKINTEHTATEWELTLTSSDLVITAQGLFTTWLLITVLWLTILESGHVMNKLCMVAYDNISSKIIIGVNHLFTIAESRALVLLS